MKGAVRVPNGYMGSMLWVDLGTGEVRTEPVTDELQEKYLGGYGIGARLLLDRMRPGVDPLGPENILGFITGPLTGTPCIEGNRFTVVCKSPLTHTWGDANCGGTFGPGLRFAGYDAVFFTGAAERPVYLLIDDGRAELRPADHLWGQDAVETEEALLAEYGPKDVYVACIGQAGEGLSLISAIMNDRGRAAGRSGVGAVMGSKRLKAIVARGRREVPVHDPALARELRRKYLKEHTGSYDSFSSTGTTGSIAWSAKLNDSGVKNWTESGPDAFADGIKNFDTDTIMAYRTRKYGCWKCTMACGGFMEVKSGPYKVHSHKVEYETGAAFGAMTLNSNFESIIYANELCNRYGFDTISAGATVAFAIECYERGLITRDEAGGLELTWGNHAAIIELLRQMGLRQGIGDVLADGVRAAAGRIGRGAEAFAVHVGGQETAQHDPRLIPGLTASYLLDATPGRHTQGCEEWGYPGVSLGRFKREQYSGRGEAHKIAQMLMHVINAAGVCQFGAYSYPFDFIPDFLAAVTGRTYTRADLVRAGERMHALRHLFNLREGHNPLDRTLPGRVAGNPPLAAGKLAGVTLDTDTLVREFLTAMDYDPDTARPSPAKLAELGLADLVELAAAG